MNYELRMMNFGSLRALRLNYYNNDVGDFRSKGSRKDFYFAVPRLPKGNGTQRQKKKIYGKRRNRLLGQALCKRADRKASFDEEDR